MVNSISASIFFRLLDRKDAYQLEECRLKHGVHSDAEVELSCDLLSVADIEVDAVLCDVSLDVARKASFELFVGPWAVEQEFPAWLDIFYDAVLFDV